MSKLKEKRRLETFCRYFFIYFIVSFLGWAWETVFVFVRAGGFRDRGLLFLPLCPVYGNGVLLLYFALGTPSEGRGLLKHTRSRLILYAAYLLASFVLPTAVELLVGVTMHKLFSVRLWNYKKFPLNFGGYICLPASLVWAIGATLFMRFVFPRLKKCAFALPCEKLLPSQIALALATAVDFAVSLAVI